MKPNLEPAIIRGRLSPHTAAFAPWGRRLLCTSGFLKPKTIMKPRHQSDQSSGVATRRNLNARTGVESEDRPTRASSESNAVRPFKFKIPDAELADLRRRIEATRWPDRETVPDATQGVQLATMQALARYWATDYDWRKCEAKLNVLPQFITQIDGLDIHFIHVRSKHENALPVIVTHGWPGSIIELL